MHVYMGTEVSEHIISVLIASTFSTVWQLCADAGGREKSRNHNDRTVIGFGAALGNNAPL